MNYLLIEFFSKYSITTLIIAVISAVISVILRLIFKNKLSNFFRNFFPMILSIILAILVDVIITEKKFTITENAICLGFTSGSLSTLILVVLTKIQKGEKITANTLSLIVEGLISGYVKKEKVIEVTNSITVLIEKVDVSLNKEQIEYEIKQILLENLNEEISILELDSITSMIIGIKTQNTTKYN